MKRFNKARISKTQIKFNKIKLAVPTIMVEPIVSSTDTLCIFVNGLNGEINMLEYFDDPAFDNKYLFSYDQRAQGSNKNKAARNYRTYLRDLHQIVNYLKNEMPQIKNIILFGESWGTALIILYNKKYAGSVNKVIGCNMPYEVKRMPPISIKQAISTHFKTGFTFFSNIDTRVFSPFNNKLTSNKILMRIAKMNSNNKYSTKVTLASWMSFRKAWRVLLKEMGNPETNVFYVQSGDDFMKSKKNRLIKINEITKKHYIKLKKGFHILTFEANSHEYFNLI